ncbi:MAG: alpha/beta hydrolase [Actinomycetota bacterium]|nr:alpha/beta hydrolase [Actinomycetota bacterium]
MTRRVLTVATLTTVAASALWWQHRHQVARRWRPPAGDHHDLALHVRTLGEGPPVVLLHGLLGSGRFWGAEFDRLAHVYRLVTPDLLGFGRSPRPDHGYTPDDHADAVAATLDMLGVATPAVVAGHSLGALVALRLAVRHPERVAAIVAFGPPLYPDAETARRHISGLGGLAPMFALDTPRAARVCEWMCAHRTVSAWLAVAMRPDLPIPIARDSVQHTWPSYSRTMSHVIIAAHADAWLDHLTIPIVVIAGDNDPVVDHGHLAELAARHPQFILDRWSGGHDLPLSRPSECRARIAGVTADHLRGGSTPTRSNPHDQL